MLTFLPVFTSLFMLSKVMLLENATLVLAASDILTEASWESLGVPTGVLCSFLLGEWRACPSSSFVCSLFNRMINYTFLIAQHRQFGCQYF